MTIFPSLILTELRQALFSIRFLLCTCSVTLIMLFPILGTDTQIYTSVVYLYGLALGGSTYVLLVGILPLFPFATSFATEWNNRAISFWIIRTGVKNYTVSKLITNAFVGFLTTAIGMILFTLILRIKFPFFVDMHSDNAYVPLLYMDMPISYLFFHITHVSLTSILFATIALWISTYFPNKFITLAAPLVLYFVLHRFTTQLNIPAFFKAHMLVEQIYDAGSPLLSLLVKLGIVFCLCLIMGFATFKQIQRKIRHD